MSDDPKLDEACEGVISALTCFYSGDIRGADRELTRVKVGVPEEACDFMFGCLASLVEQVAEDRDPLELVQQMGLMSARIVNGLEDVSDVEKRWRDLLRDLDE